MPPDSVMAAAGTASQTGGGTSAGSRPKLEHAYLQLFEPPKDGGQHMPGAKMGRIDFQFNPKELVVAKAAKWDRKAGGGKKNSGPVEYQGPAPSKLALEMFFDASRVQDGSVVKVVDQLFSCCVPTGSSGSSNKAAPPWTQFRWGALTGFMGYIGSVSVKYTLFTSAGLPVRATATVTLEEISGEPAGQNPTSGALAARRVHSVIHGDTLAGLAYREYGKASLWRAVAAANNIDNPMRLAPGTAVFLPAAEELQAWDPSLKKEAGHAARE